MFNQAMTNLNADVTCNVLPTIKSNHSPLLIHIRGRNTTRQRLPYLFRYEAAWKVREECSNIVLDTWSRGLNTFQGKLNSYNEARGDDSKEDKTYSIKECTTTPNGAQVEINKLLQKELQIQLEEEDLKWRQRAKQYWLKQGDRNTIFFHS